MPDRPARRDRRRTQPRLRLRFRGITAHTKLVLATEGEAGRFEFKRDDQAVTARVLVAAANAAALDGLPFVTILVGVDERQDEDTGVVTGEIVGLQNMERAKQRIVSRASSIRPTPIGLTVVEEGVGTRKPILRLEVRPTRVPHYDGDGARVTRYGASTRPITDDELVDLYLQREAAAFEARFRRTARELIAELEDISAGARVAQDEIRQIASSLGDVQREAERVGAISEETFEFLSSIDEQLGHIQDQVAPGHPSAEDVWWELVQARHTALMGYHLYKRNGRDFPASVEDSLEGLASGMPKMADYEANYAEARPWRDFVVAMEANDLDAMAQAFEGIKRARAEPPAIATMAYFRRLDAKGR